MSGRDQVVTGRTPNIRVATVDDTGNDFISDVIGNRNDAPTTDSLAGRIHSIEEHNHSAARVYPSLAGGVNIIDGGAAWTYGAYVQVVPAATIQDPFDIHWLIFESISANDIYQIEVVYGAGDTYAGEKKFVRTAVQEQTGDVPFMTVIIPANSRIRARIASAGGGNNVDLSIAYHLYD